MSATISRAEYVAQLVREALDVPGLPDTPLQEAAPALGEPLPPEQQPEEPALLTAWDLRTLGDAYKSRPPLEYAVAGIVALGTLCIVFGAPGSLKSMLLADLAVCIAAGLPWLPLLGSTEGGLATIRFPVLWIDLDNGTRRSDERFDALGHARDLSPDIPLFYVSMPAPWLDASSETLMHQVAELVQHLEVKVVFIDNLGLITGGVSEIDAAMAKVMANLRRLCEETEAAVIVVHHQRKSNGTGTRKGDSLRGHSSIEASLDLALHVDRKEGSDTVTVTPTKMRGATFAPLAAQFAYDHHAGTKELAKARFFSTVIDNSGSDDGIDKALLEVVREQGELNKTALRDAAKTRLSDVGINRISDRIDYLVSTGSLVSRKGAKGPTEVLIRLP